MTDDMLQMVAHEANKNSVELDGRAVNTSPQEIEQVLGMYLLMGIVQMPNVRSYWENETCDDLIANVMTRSKLEKLARVIHFTDNNTASDHVKQDKLWKVRPWLQALWKEYQSVDETMVLFKGRSHLKVCMPNKPHKWGFKMWERSWSTGILCDFDVYQGGTSEPSDLGVNSSIVTKLTDTLPAGMSFKVYADNYFTSIPLVEKLKHRDIFYIGTVKMNRVKSIKISDDQAMKKRGRGATAYSLRPML